MPEHIVGKPGPWVRLVLTAWLLVALAWPNQVHAGALTEAQNKSGVRYQAFKGVRKLPPLFHMVKGKKVQAPDVEYSQGIAGTTDDYTTPGVRLYFVKVTNNNKFWVKAIFRVAAGHSSSLIYQIYEASNAVCMLYPNRFSTTDIPRAVNKYLTFNWQASEVNKTSSPPLPHYRSATNPGTFIMGPKASFKMRMFVQDRYPNRKDPHPQLKHQNLFPHEDYRDYGSPRIVARSAEPTKLVCNKPKKEDKSWRQSMELGAACYEKAISHKVEDKKKAFVCREVIYKQCLVDTFCEMPTPLCRQAKEEVGQWCPEIRKTHHIRCPGCPPEMDLSISYSPTRDKVIKASKHSDKLELLIRCDITAEGYYKKGDLNWTINCQRAAFYHCLYFNLNQDHPEDARSFLMRSRKACLGVPSGSGNKCSVCR